VRVVETCGDPLTYASLRGEPDWQVRARARARVSVCRDETWAENGPITGRFGLEPD
jgi:hypothetical protein